MISTSTVLSMMLVPPALLLLCKATRMTFWPQTLMLISRTSFLQCKAVFRYKLYRGAMFVFGGNQCISQEGAQSPKHSAKRL